MQKIWAGLCQLQFLILLIMFAFLGLAKAPGDYIPVFNDKLMHSGGYFVAAFSISFAYPAVKFVWRSLFLISYSLLIEIAQHFDPPRSFDLLDLLANSTGVICGLVGVWLMIKKIPLFSNFINRNF